MGDLMGVDVENAMGMDMQMRLDNSTPSFHDYSHLACCLIFFFWWTGFAVVAYCKGKAAVAAFGRADYKEYRNLNKQARSYMVIAVGIALVLVLVVVFSVALAEGETDPQTEIPEEN